MTVAKRKVRYVETKLSRICYAIFIALLAVAGFFFSLVAKHASDYSDTLGDELAARGSEITKVKAKQETALAEKQFYQTITISIFTVSVAFLGFGMLVRDEVEEEESGERLYENMFL